MALGFCGALMGSGNPDDRGWDCRIGSGAGACRACSTCSRPSFLLLGVCGLFGIFHGYAHGAEIASAVSAVDYGAGFLLASALLLSCGLGLESAVRRVPAMSQVFGGGIALAGAALFVV